MDNKHIIYQVKNKPLYYYHLIFVVLLLVCFFIYTIAIITCIVGKYFNRFDPVFVCLVIVYMIITIITIIAIFQYKHSVKLYESFKNLSHILNENNFWDIQNEKELNIEDLFKSVKHILEGPYKKNEQLVNTIQQLENKLQSRDQLESVHHEFIANASHELKTPLGLLILYAEGLKNNIDNIDKDYYCDVIIEVVQNLDRKINRLMSVTTIESGLSPMRMECFNYSELFKCINDRFSIMLLDFNTYVEYDKDIYVYGDIYYLGEVIKNFITNAVAYTEKGKIIQIKLKKTEKHAELSVYNECINMEPECLKKIWGSYYKGKNKSVNGDTECHIGMGLYIVSLVMEQHNGIYGVDNMPDGLRFYTKLELI